VERQLLLLGSFGLLFFSGLLFAALGGEAIPELLEPELSTGGVGVVCMGIALFVVLIVTLHLLQAKQKTLVKFEDATRRLTTGDYSLRINLDSRSEFHTLASAFNDLTEQLEESVQTSLSLADIDSLILSGAKLEAIIRRVLLAAQMEAVEVSLLLRPDMTALQVIMYGLSGQRMRENVVGLLDMSSDALLDVDGFRSVYSRVSSDEVLDCFPVSCDDNIAGALVATGHRNLKASEVKRLTDLVDRLSVAITNIRRSESLYQQAHFDALTGLINRRAFEDRLRESLSRSWRGENGVLLFIDLDGFKKVNDTEGHEAGDRLLVMVAERLREAIRPEDIIARLGGDEFAIIAPGCGDDKSVSHLCERIITAVTQPVVVDRIEHSVGASIGVVLYPNDSTNFDELVMKADSAMYRAKETGGSRYAFFDDSLNEVNKRRVLVESRLRNAIKNSELEVYFQPKLHLRNWSVNSVEALLRWQDEKLGQVDPATFVGIAEETGLIHEIMPILVDRTADLISSAARAGVAIGTVAINASPKQLMTEGFALATLSLLDRWALPHEKIELEVTETVFARDMEQVVNELEILRTAGMKIALDDFGTGYSSLNMLRELSLDVVKIDRAFITELETSAQARAMVQHLIRIAGTLGLEVVAEGVETEIQLQHLLATDCDYIQGWLIAKALPKDELINMLLSRRVPNPGELGVLASSSGARISLR
jgi:diguanylate cyclase (GGDEF)-like protein